MKTQFYLKVIVAMCVAVGSAAQANTALADMMNVISDQLTEINSVSKLVPKDVPARTFSRLQSRCRAAQLVFALLDEKKGTLDAAGTLVSAQFTPDFLKNVAEAELASKLDEYAKMLMRASADFGKIETEVAAQAALADATARDFTRLKTLAGELATTMREAHKLFRP